jgi:hypothetical protein
MDIKRKKEENDKKKLENLNWNMGESTIIKSCIAIIEKLLYFCDIISDFFFGITMIDIDTKFSLLLAMINLRRKTCGAHKVGYLLPTEFYFNGPIYFFF